MRGEHTREEYGGHERKLKEVETCRDTHRHRYRECEQTKHEAFFAALDKLVHVDFETCEEHDVEESSGSRHYDSCVADYEVEAVGPDDCSSED